MIYIEKEEEQYREVIVKQFECLKKKARHAYLLYIL